jgi:hypothetical protein
LKKPIEHTFATAQSKLLPYWGRLGGGAGRRSNTEQARRPADAFLFTETSGDKFKGIHSNYFVVVIFSLSSFDQVFNVPIAGVSVSKWRVHVISAN